jgi:hypothetical protein
MRMRGAVVLTAVLVVLAVLGGGGAAYASHFRDRALPGTAVAGVSVAGMTRAEAADTLRDRADAVTVELRSEDGTRTEHLADLGVTVDVDATVDAAFVPNDSWTAYATSFVSPLEVDVVVDVDTERMDAVAAELVQDAGRVGRDARVELAEDEGSFVVVPAVTGQTVTRASLNDVVVAAARGLTSATTTLEFVDTQPDVTDAAAREVADAANALVDRDVTISDGTEVHSASAARKASWVTVTTDEGALADPVVDAEKVQQWVDSVASAAARAPTDGVRYVDSDGGVRAVITQAVDGRSASNAAPLGTSALAALADGQDYAGELEYDPVPASWTERRIAAGAEKLAYPAAEGEKWVDVDLSRHTMTAYVGAEAVKGPVRMVDGSAELPTVTGTFHVYLKYEKMDMRGTNADGTEYETKDVPWVSFFHGGYGLHGAPWRDSFGYSDCVNLPVGVAKWLYDFAPVGTPVVSHR